MPIVVRSGLVRRLDIRGLPLGILEHVDYRAHGVELAPGDMVVLCSDGLEESQNTADELFGFERLAETLQRVADEPAQCVADRLLQTTDEHSGARPPHDDRTVVVLKQMPRA
jgi:sigma-B regulation protein RsbU (phosphoserine phosphatase)